MEAQRIERAKAEHRAAVREANKKTKVVEAEPTVERRSGRTAKPVATDSKKGLTRKGTKKRKAEEVEESEPVKAEDVQPELEVQIEKAEEEAVSALSKRH